MLIKTEGGSSGASAPAPAPSSKATGKAPARSGNFECPAMADDEDDPATYHKLVALIKSKGVAFKHLGPHDHTPTSEASAALRVRLGWTDVTLASGAKAMLITNSKNKEQPYSLAVMAADHQLDWKKMKKLLTKGKNARMASVVEAWEVTKCKPGGVPPFGSLFEGPGGVKTFVDPSLQAQGVNCNFNCGLRTRSMQMAVADYIALEQPEIANFCS
jgi:prolyl-tRNA editing enzyme YbaK/EbsC (Cys-tRNA(Pro) deacylase)